MSERTPDNSHGAAPQHRPFRWSKVKEEAAVLVAHDELTHAQIAERLNIGLRTVYEWQARPEFRARVEENALAMRAAIRSSGIAIVENRIRHYQRRHDLMNRVIAERAKDPKMANVPGGTTGLLVHNVKSVGAGMAAERVDLYEVDTALLKELREHEKQAAQELGQWADKQEHTGANGGPIQAETTIRIQADLERCASEFESFARQRMGDGVLPSNGN